MTDTMPEQTEDWSDVEHDADGAAYPEYPANPHNHRFTVSMNGQGPMIVVRGNTAEEINAAFQELEEHATGAIMGSAWSSIKAAAMVANGLGASPAPAAPPAPPQGMPQLPQYPQPAQAVPGVPGTAPAAWQNVGAPTPPAPPQGGGGGVQAAPQGWYRMNVPFKGSADLHALATQMGVARGNPGRGYYNFWSAPTKAWYCAPEVVQHFAQYTPVPA